MQSKAPWTLVFGASQPHAFDALDPSPESRRLVAQTVDFLAPHHGAAQGSDSKHPEEQEVLRAMYNNDRAGHDRHSARPMSNGILNSARARAELGRRLARCRPVRRGSADACARACSRPGKRRAQYRRLARADGAEQARRKPISRRKARSTAGPATSPRSASLGLRHWPRATSTKPSRPFAVPPKRPVARASSFTISPAHWP